MTQRTQDTIISNTKSVFHDLETLRVAHASALSNIGEADEDEQKSRIIKKNLEMIDFGLGEAHAMLTLANYLENIEGKMQVLKTLVRRLQHENNWLREDLTNAQKKLQASEMLVAQLEEEKKHLEFMASIKKYDVNQYPEESDIDPIDELFPDEDYDESSSNTSSIVPSQFSNQSIDYKIPDHLKILYNIVIHYASQGRYEVAVPLCKQTLKDLEIVIGHNHPDVASMLNILALVYRDHYKYKDAAKLLNDVVSIQEKNFGENHLAIASTLNNLAILYCKIGNYKAAEPLCKRALEIREEQLGKDHPDVAKQLNNLALLYQNQGKYDEVEKYYQRALEIFNSKLGPNDANVAKAKNNLASCYLRQGKYDEAEILYKQVLTREHECEIEAIVCNNKPTWLVAEERDEHKCVKRENKSNEENEGRHETVKFDSSNTTTTLKTIVAFCRTQVIFMAAGYTFGLCKPNQEKKNTDF